MRRFWWVRLWQEVIMPYKYQGFGAGQTTTGQAIGIGIVCTLAAALYVFVAWSLSP